MALLLVGETSIYSRQLHAHEHSGHEEAKEDADKSDEKQQEAVEFGNVWCVGAVQDYKAQASHCEEETGGQSLHNVLPIYSGRQMCFHITVCGDHHQLAYFSWSLLRCLNVVTNIPVCQKGHWPLVSMLISH